jgi:hypothetical protein
MATTVEPGDTDTFIREHSGWRGRGRLPREGDVVTG